MREHRTLIVSLLIPLATGACSALLTRGQWQLYRSLRLPALAPKPWVFPLVWTVLYLLMGYGCWLCLEAPASSRTPALLLYAAQLVLNFCWPILFFNQQEWFAALLLLIALLMVTVVMTITFRQCRKLAGWLQIPYCLWLVFALYLNWMIFLQN